MVRCRDLNDMLTVTNRQAHGVSTSSQGHIGFASPYASSGFANLRRIASPFGQGFIKVITEIPDMRL